MSERLRSAAREGDAEAALREAALLLQQDRAHDLADALLDLLTGESAWLREAAIGVLRGLPPEPTFVDRLLEELASATHADRRNAARSALATLASPGAVDPAIPLPRLLEQLRDDPDVDVRILSANALGDSRNPRARAALEAALADPEANVVAAAAEALGELNDPRAVNALIALAERRDFWTGNAAVLALGRLRDARAVDILSQLTTDPWLAAEAARALGSTGGEEALEVLRAMLEMPDDQRMEAIRAAAEIVARVGLPVPDWLRLALRDGERELSQRVEASGDPEAARLLGLAGSRSAAETLLDRLRDDPDGAAAVGLEAIPTATRAEAIIVRLDQAAPQKLPPLLALLPPLSDRAQIEAVALWLAHADTEVRSAAAEALSRSDAGQVMEVLAAMRSDPGARVGVALTYGRMGSDQCTALLEMLVDPDPAVRAAAADGVGRCGLATAARLAEVLNRERDPLAARALVRALGMVGGSAAVEALGGVFQAGDPALRFEAVRALGSSASPEAFPLLLDALDDPDAGIRTMALSSLGELGDLRAEAPVSRHIDDPDRDRRRVAAAALDRLQGEDAAGRLEAALHDTDREVRMVAVRAVRRLSVPGAIAALERVAEDDPDPLVRRAAVTEAAVLRDSAPEAV